MEFINFNAPGAGCMDLGVPILMKMCLALEAYMYIKNGMANLKSPVVYKLLNSWYEC